MKKTIKVILLYLPAIICMLLIFYFSAQTGEKSSVLSDEIVGTAYGEENIGIERLTIIVRKTAHFLEYALLGSLIFIGNINAFGQKSILFNAGMAVLAAVLYAASDEVHQYFVPGRACRAFDVFIDACGAFTATALITVTIKAVSNIKNKPRKEKS